MKISAIMTAHARCVAPDNSLVEAAGLMRQLDVGALPVCENDRLAGIVTDRDIVVRALADGRDPNATPVRDAMSPGITWVFADQDVEEAVRIMEHKQVRRLPVMNREKRLVGIVSLGDIALSSNPAFSGIALREVSDSEQTRDHRGAREEAASARMTSFTKMPGEKRRAPTRTRSRQGSRSAGSRKEATGARGRSRSGRATHARHASGANSAGKSGRSRTGGRKTARTPR